MCVRFSQGRGWTLDPTSGQWVCSDCRKPSKAVYQLEIAPKETEVAVTKKTAAPAKSIDDLIEALNEALIGFGYVITEQPATKSRRTKAAAEPEPDEDDEVAEEADDEDDGLDDMSLVQLKKLAKQRNFDPDEVDSASKKELIATIRADMAGEGEGDDEDTDDEDTEDETVYEEAELKKMTIVKLRKLAVEEFGFTPKDLEGKDKAAVIEEILEEQENGSDEDDADDEGEDEGYTEEELQAMSIAEIKAVAKEAGIRIKPGMKKAAIIEEILAADAEVYEDDE